MSATFDSVEINWIDNNAFLQSAVFSMCSHVYELIE